MKASIIVPAFNEEDTIVESLRGVLDLDLGGVEKEVIVADDCSTDRTVELALHEMGSSGKLVRLQKNSGKGAAIREALKVATGEIIVIHDADLEYDPRDIPALVAPIASGKAVAVYGTRFANNTRPEGMKFANYIANKLLTWGAVLLFGGKLTDEATCYKAVSTELLRSMNLQCQHFEFCPEVTAKLMRAGHKIHEEPIRYRARTMAEGKKIHWTDGLEAFWTLLKYRFVK